MACMDCKRGVRVAKTGSIGLCTIDLQCVLRDPAYIYKLATIANVATVCMAHQCASPARVVATQTVSPLTKLAIKSLVNTCTAKNIDNIHLHV